MINKLYHYTLTLILVTTAFCSCGNTTPDNDTSDTIAQATLLDKQLNDDIGEMLLIGFKGQSVTPNSHVIRDIQQYHVGSVILFEYDATTGTRHRNIANPKQLKKLCNELQKANTSNLPLLISIDQEGGKVCRMRHQDGFPLVRSAKYCATHGYDTVSHYAKLTATMLSEAGINFDFAPVADVDVNPLCPVIGKMERSFSADTNIVTQCCSIWIDELRRQHIASCMKHFPGHGSASGDTHAGLVDVSQTFQDYELAPYRTLIAQQKIPSVMVAHVVNHNIDSQWPASLSYNTITKLLRNEMNFDGVVVTDDLAMGAIINHYAYDTVVYRAIYAGADLLCISNNGANGYDPEIVPKTVAIIHRLIDDGKISKEQIHASAERVRKLKRSLSK